ncbi:MAG: CoA transferase [Chloroflexi bacterium]|nr:CoA transferase [Chloroflexota bacterium]
MADNFVSALHSIKVLDLTEERGLYAGKMLADMGADVIKIEKPAGSKARRIGPFKDDVPGIENSLYFLNFNTNKRGITLNMDSSAGREIFKRLAQRADIVIEDFEVGVMQSLGLDYPALRELNQGIIMASVTGFGQTGPYRMYKAPDMVSFAVGGMMNLNGPRNAAPVVAPCEQSYYSASVAAVFGSLTALFLRIGTGEGQLVDVSAHEVVATYASEIMSYSNTSRIGQRNGSQFGSVPGRIYPCKDGYVHILTVRANHWQGFREAMGNPETVMGKEWDNGMFRNRNVDTIDAVVTEFTMKHTKMEITEMCQVKGVPCTPVNTPAEFSQDAHMKARGFFVEIEHPVMGRHSYLNPPYRLSKTVCRIERPAPLLGQHNREVYGGELGHTDKELAELKSEGII